jgi:hypothetical protein
MNLIELLELNAQLTQDWDQGKCSQQACDQKDWQHDGEQRTHHHQSQTKTKTRQKLLLPTRTGSTWKLFHGIASCQP